MSRTTAVKVPPNTIKIVHGRIRRVENWIRNMYDQPECAIELERLDDGRIHTRIGDDSSFGTIEEVTRCLHPSIALQYVQAFNLVNADAQSVHATGLSWYEVIIE